MVAEGKNVFPPPLRKARVITSFMRKREPVKSRWPFAARLGLVEVDRVTDVRHNLIDPANDAAFMITRTSLSLLVRPVVSMQCALMSPIFR